jgi:hypothetical protein
VEGAVCIEDDPPIAHMYIYCTVYRLYKNLGGSSVKTLNYTIALYAGPNKEIKTTGCSCREILRSSKFGPTYVPERKRDRDENTANVLLKHIQAKT